MRSPKLRIFETQGPNVGAKDALSSFLRMIRWGSVRHSRDFSYEGPLQFEKGPLGLRTCPFCIISGKWGPYSYFDNKVLGVPYLELGFFHISGP